MPVLARTWHAFRNSFVAAYHDDAFGIAKGAAYSALLAFFPLLATVATILLRFQANFISDAISNFLSEILPPGTQDLVFYYFAIRGKQPVLLPITGMLISIWAGSGVMVSLMQGFHAAYHIKSNRSFVRERIVAILLVISAAIPVLFASGLIFFGLHAERWLLGLLGLVPAGAELRGHISLLGHVVRYAVSFIAAVLAACILYYVAPSRRQRWRNVWPGAVFTTVAGLAAISVFAWYVRNLANYNVMYGSIAAVILLLVWMYVLAVIAFIGCEFNAQFEQQGR
jgi:membrane protein